VSTRGNLAKWVFASIAKSFSENLSGLTMHIEGEERNLSGQSDWCELRIDGPKIAEISKDLLKISTEVNVLVATFRDKTTLYRESENIGKVVTAMVEHINIYKYGNQDGDDGTKIGCLKILPRADLTDATIISRFGQIDSSVNLFQTTVESHYEALISI